MNNKVNRFLLYANPLLLAKLMMKKKDVPPVPPVAEKYFKFNVLIGIPEIEKIKIIVGERQYEITGQGQFILKENETMSWDFVDDPPIGTELYLTCFNTTVVPPTNLDIFKNGDTWISEMRNLTSGSAPTDGKLISDSFERYEQFHSGSTLQLVLTTKIIPTNPYVNVYVVNENVDPDSAKLFIGGKTYDIPDIHGEGALECELKPGDLLRFEPQVGGNKFAEIYADDTYSTDRLAKVFDSTEHYQVTNTAQFESLNRSGATHYVNVIKMRDDAFDTTKTYYVVPKQTVYIDVRDNESPLLHRFHTSAAQGKTQCGFDVKIKKGTSDFHTIHTDVLEADDFMVENYTGIEYTVAFFRNNYNKKHTKIIAYVMDNETKIPANIFKVGSSYTSTITSNGTENITINSVSLENYIKYWHIWLEWEDDGEATNMLEVVCRNHGTSGRAPNTLHVGRQSIEIGETQCTQTVYLEENAVIDFAIREGVDNPHVATAFADDSQTTSYNKFKGNNSERTDVSTIYSKQTLSSEEDAQMQVTAETISGAQTIYLDVDYLS